jgi:hypothetical protein
VKNKAENLTNSKIEKNEMCKRWEIGGSLSNDATTFKCAKFDVYK